MRFALSALLLVAACDQPYRSQIGEVPGPETAPEDPAARARWRPARVEVGGLWAIACVAGGARGDVAVAVGQGGAVVRVGADGGVSAAPVAPTDLAAITATRSGLVAAGPGALWTTDGPRLERWQRHDLPRPDALPLSLAAGPADTLWVAGRAPRGNATVGWVARRRQGRWTQHLVEDAPSVLQVLPRGEDDAILVVEATPYVWTPSTDSIAYLMPAQPDAHPQIVAMDRRPGGFLAAGVANVWRLDGTTLVRELRQLYMRLEAVAALPDGRAVAVGHEDPPGGRSGGLVLARDRAGHWSRELLVDGSPLHAVAHCGSRTIAVGDAGLVAIRAD